MNCRLLVFAFFLLLAGCGLLLLAGCGGRQSPGKAVSSGPSVKAPTADSSQTESSEQEHNLQSTAKAVPKSQSAKSTATYRWPPDFQLPLKIDVDAPEPPPEITRPSPPIQEESPSSQEKTQSAGRESHDGQEP